MDTDQVVESQIDHGRSLLEQLVAGGFDVSAAAWVKTADDEEWNLYVVSKVVAEQGPAPAYGAAGAVIQQIPDAWASNARLKLVAPDTPVGRHLLNLRREYGSAPVRMRLMRLGDIAALEVFLYPPVPRQTAEHPALTPREVIQKVVGLMGRTGSLPPSRVILLDGTSFTGMPFGLELNGKQMNVKFVLEGTASPRSYPVEVIRSIE